METRDMTKRLNILHLEDEPDFAELVRTLLAQDGLAFEAEGRVFLTPRGQLVADSVAGMFV